MWDWLKNYPYTWGFVLRVLVKGLLLFGLVNLGFALAKPLPSLGKISLYNLLISGRERLPYGENPSESYNLSLDNLNAMFASHVIAQSKAEDEYRVVLIGDSATWGFLLENKDTLAGQLNAGNYQSADGRNIQVYNLGYPTMSLTKDLMLLDLALQHDPDLIIWLVTLESFPRREQSESPLVANNPATVNRLIAAYDLHLTPLALQDDFWENTLVGQRRPLADWLRLQIYGVAWQVTGIDQAIPDQYTLRQADFEEDYSWHGLAEPQPIPEDYLAFEVLAAGLERAGDTPLLLVNEPMFISTGINSEIRYNFFYPRWIYDDYRAQLSAFAEKHQITYLDLWDMIPPAEFTDSPVHMTPAGTGQLAARLGAEMSRHETE